MTKLTLARVKANVILTFQNTAQAIYDATAVLPLVPLSTADKDGMETDTIVQLLNCAPTGCVFDELVKISVCYNADVGDLANRGLAEVDPTAHAVALEHIDFLCRNQAKYYFQPDQRDAYEQAIVDRLGIASKTPAFA